MLVSSYVLLFKMQRMGWGEMSWHLCELVTVEARTGNLGTVHGIFWNRHHITDVLVSYELGGRIVRKISFLL